MNCESCEKHLSQVLLTGRPRKLLDAIRQGVYNRKYSGEGSADPATDVLPPKELQVECHICPTTGDARDEISKNNIYQEGPAAGARAFLESPPPGVVLCANRLGSRQEVEEAVVHELVHAYDYMVAGIELRKCHSLAYSEVRAAHAAECSETSRSFTCSYFKKHCVRSTAKRSTEGIFPGEGAACVDAVFDAAYKDKGPHDALAGKGGGDT